jgi:hypothetical protein
MLKERILTVIPYFEQCFIANRVIDVFMYLFLFQNSTKQQVKKFGTGAAQMPSTM